MDKCPRHVLPTGLSQQNDPWETRTRATQARLMYSATKARNVKRAQSCTSRERRERDSGKQARCEPPRAPTGRGDIYTENSPEGKRTSPPKKTAEGTPGSRTQRTTRRRTHTRPESHREETGEGRNSQGKNNHARATKEKAARGTRRTEKPHSAAETSRKEKNRKEEKS